MIPTAITAGASRVASGLLCLHAIAITPAGSMEHARSCLSIDCGLPCEKVRSAPAIIVSGPAQRSLMLWPARSQSRLATLYIESSDSFVASAAVSIVTGWSEPVPGRELHPLKSSAFHGALFRHLTGSSCSCWVSSTSQVVHFGRQSPLSDCMLRVPSAPHPFTSGSPSIQHPKAVLRTITRQR